MARVSNEALKEIMLEKFQTMDEKYKELKTDVRSVKDELTENNENTNHLIRKVITGNGEKSILARLAHLESWFIILSIAMLVAIILTGYEKIIPILGGFL